MRMFSALVLVGLIVAACTPDIPVNRTFGVSALRATGAIPPEFAAFNQYDPRVKPLLAQQVCTTPYDPQAIRALAAVPGEIEAMQAQCRTYQPWFAKLYGEQPTQ